MIERTLAEEWTLVTNNVREFHRCYRHKVPLHAGVIFLVGIDAGPEVQIEAFEAALDDIDLGSDLMSGEVLVQCQDDGSYLISRVPLP